MSDIIVPIIIPQHPNESDSEKANKEAINRYDDEPRREAFRSGARWERGDDSSDITRGDVLGFILVIWVIVQVVLFFIPGSLEGCNGYMIPKCSSSSKWVYVFPGMRAGQYFGDWMSK